MINIISVYFKTCFSIFSLQSDILRGLGQDVRVKPEQANRGSTSIPLSPHVYCQRPHSWRYCPGTCQPSCVSMRHQQLILNNCQQQKIYMIYVHGHSTARLSKQYIAMCLCRKDSLPAISDIYTKIQFKLMFTTTTRCWLLHIALRELVAKSDNSAANFVVFQCFNGLE